MKLALRRIAFKDGIEVLNEIIDFDAIHRPVAEDQRTLAYLECWFQGKVNDWNRLGTMRASRPGWVATNTAYYYELVKVSDNTTLPLKWDL